MSLKLKKTISFLTEWHFKSSHLHPSPNILMTTGIASPHILTEVIILVCFFAGSHVSCFIMLY